MSVDTRVSGGTVILPTTSVEADVLIEGERILGVVDREADVNAETVIDADGQIVMPGIVDPHVHVADYNTIDGYESGSAAAALGGVTSFITFAFQAWTGEKSIFDEPGTLGEAVERHRERGQNSLVDHSVHAVISREDKATLEELETLVDDGVTSIKLFSTYENGLSYGFMNEVFERSADEGLVVAVHTEDDSIVSRRTAGAIEQDRKDSEDYPPSRPDYAEAIAANAAARMALEHGANYYGVHTTCREALEALKRYLSEPTVRAETCAHYLTLDESAYSEQGQLPVIAPPLRTPDDMDALFDALESGMLSIVSTDHVAQTRSAKEAEPWWNGPFGANSLQNCLPVVHEVAVNRRDFSYPFLARVMSDAPARTFGLSKKGRIESGMDADLVLFDPSASYTITADDNASEADYSIYEGMEVTGRVTKTILRGDVVAADGEIVGEPGDGEFLERTIPNWGGE